MITITESQQTQALDSDRPVLYAMPGFVGSLFITLGSLGVAWFPLNANVLNNSVIRYLHTNSIGLALSRSLVIVGVALLLQAWLIVGVDALKGRISGLRTMYIALAAWCLPLLIAPPLFSRDVYSYYMQGRLQNDGLDPYTCGVSLIPGWFRSGVDPLWGDAPSPYGPVFLGIERVIAYISPHSSLMGSYLFKITSLASLAGLAWCIPKLARMHGINASPALWLGVMNPLGIMHFVAGEHNDALLILAMTASLYFALRNRIVIAILCSALAIGIKPIALVLIPFLALIICRDKASLMKRIRMSLAITSAYVPIMLVISYLVGVNPMGWLSALTTPASVRSWLSPSTAVGMMSGKFLQVIGFGNHTDLIITVCRSVSLLILIAFLVGLFTRPAGRSAVRGCAEAILMLVVLGPVAQPWYLLWALPLFAVSSLTRHQVRFAVFVLSAFTIQGLATWGATADTFFEFSDGVAVILSIGILILAALSSRQERELILGTSIDQGLMPRDDAAQARALSRIITA